MQGRPSVIEIHYPTQRCRTCQANAEDAEGETDSATMDVTLCAFSDCDESIHVGNGIGIDMVLIHNGSFVMGSSPGEAGRDGDENQFPATLTNDYYMSTTEISQGMYEMLMGDIWTPASAKRGRCLTRCLPQLARGITPMN